MEKEGQKPARESKAAKLINQIGVYDSAALPDDYNPGPRVPAKGVFIRGGQGSRWLNRLSSLASILVAGVLIIMAILVVKVIGKMATGREAAQAVTCPQASTGRLAILGELPAIVTGQAKLSPSIGKTVLQGETNIQELATPAGELSIKTQKGVVTEAGVTLAVPASVCDVLAGAGILALGPAQIAGNTVTSSSKALSTWTIHVARHGDLANGVDVKR